jgi:hypothetical protein
MKKLLFIFVLVIPMISLLKMNAQDDLNISKTILDKLKCFGVDVQNVELIELEPSEIKNFNDFKEEQIAHQKKYIYIWNTFNRGYVDKLDIKVNASSILKGYPVTNILDRKIETAWVEGVKGDGIGEWFSLVIHTEKKYSPSDITLFGIISGYLKSDKSWEENNRIKTALLVIKTLSPNYTKESDSFAVLRLQLKDLKEIQVFKVGRYQKYDSFTQKVWLIIEDVYKGTKYSDTCISEIYLSGACQQPSP